MEHAAMVPTSLNLSRREEEEEEEEEIISDDDTRGEEEEGEEEEEEGTTLRCVPRRPRRTTSRGNGAVRQRVQRMVVLTGPGQTHVRQATPTSSQRTEAFMTHLPDSPPRGLLSRPTIFQFADTRLRSSVVSSPVESPTNKQDQPVNEEEGDEEEEEGAREQESDGCSEEEPRPEVDESQEEEHRHEASSDGPRALDILPSSMSLPDGPLDDDVSTEGEEDEEQDDAADGNEDKAYRQLQEGRARFEAEQRERDDLRQELETYVASLSSRRDADGEKLVEFPRNFQQIVSLMTAQDIANGPTKDSSSAATASTKSTNDHKSWSQILIHNSLAKQQAFGTLDESEDAPHGEGSLAAKIALKMARIRQLDAILEEKLGKNLYSSSTATMKKAKRVNPQEPEAEGGSSATVGSRRSVSSLTKITASSTSRSSTSLTPLTDQTLPASLNYIERNRKIVENGGKANLTRDEEQRVKRLLRESREKREDSEEDATTVPTSTTEFKLDQRQHEEIERLIAEKRGLYPSAVIMALDDVPEEGDPIDSQEISGKKDCRKANVVQETKRERLRKQRLQRIEEELKFLHENESVPILPDDDDDDASDGCSSERSFMTTTSLLSTASNRSGVTRRQLDQFVATEVTKSVNCLGEKASRDEIQKLLRSLSHLPMTTSRPSTTTTTV